MKLVATQVTFIILVLVGGTQSLECKVCQQGTVDISKPIMASDNMIDDLCDDDDSLNMKACDDGENACVTYSNTFIVGPDIGNWAVTSFRCAVAEELAGPDSPFCTQFADDMYQRYRETTGGSAGSFECEVTNTEVHEDQVEEGKDCEKEFCSGGETAQLNLTLLAAVLILFRMI